MPADYTGLTTGTLSAIVDRAALRKPIAGIDQGDGTAAILVSQGSGANATQATNTTPITAGTAANTVIKGSPGRLFTVQVTTVGTNAMSFYDNATTASGTIIGQLAASAPVGTYTFNTPAVNGITAGGNAANPAVTVSWS